MLNKINNKETLLQEISTIFVCRQRRQLRTVGSLGDGTITHQSRKRAINGETTT